MMKLFDYIFYRTYKFYQKKDSSPAIYGSGVISIMQFFIMLSVLTLVSLINEFSIPNKYLMISILILIIGINWYKYEHNLDIEKFKDQWATEKENTKRRNGWLIVISLIVLILIPITIGFLKHNLTVI